MASILDEYLKRNMGVVEMQAEIQQLIGKYNKATGRYMLVYAADINKGRSKGIDVSLVQDDFYAIQDILRESNRKTIDFYIETPGGSGEAAEEIARFLRKKFAEVNFVIAGEAKSAGTILVLSGDNIFMTETGSLGPIDAQVKIGRSVVSAHDYKAWVDEKKAEAVQNKSLNPFDAVMVAQISPGEIYGVINSLEFAKDLVKEWLEKYKFKNWTVTQTQKLAVTPEMRKQRANEVAEKLCDHTTWRTHGRSLKIEDLQDVLVIERLDDDKKIADIVYRIKTVLRLLFDSSTIYKVYYLEDFKLAKTVITPGTNLPIRTPIGNQLKGLPKDANRIDMDLKCPKCSKQHKVSGYLDVSSDMIKARKLPVNNLINDNEVLVCDSCNFAIDLKPIKNQLETQIGKKLAFK